jgi:type IV secretory pathway VirD2 relaxase
VHFNNSHLARDLAAMSGDDFHLQIGRIRARGVGGPKTFVGVALAAAARAGGLPRATNRLSGNFGRGRARSLQAGAALSGQARRVVIKARVVRQHGRGAPLGVHLDYLQREGVTQDGDRGQLFGAEAERADGGAFAERCADDRHHFRFIVAPEDADQLLDLKAYTRDLMAQAERDLATHLDWVAADHWNTDQPHVHVLIRGRTDDGRDLVISRDYIAEGLRARARELATLELGPRTEREIASSLAREVQADRWTGLDRGLARDAADRGLVDLRPHGSPGDDALRTARLARLRKLQGLGLAEEAARGRWRLAPHAEATLRALGQRQDVIARMHRALAADGTARDPGAFVVDDAATEGTVGRLAGRGLDDELRGSGYAVIESTSGRIHHLPLADLDDATDAPVGAIVEVRQRAGEGRRGRSYLQVRSDLSLADQVHAEGATWLDRQLVSRTPAPLGEGGFAEEVRQALADRTEHHVSSGLAQRQGRRVLFVRDLLDTLRERELSSAAERLSRQTGLPFEPSVAEGAISGTYRQRLNLASGRFAMIDSGLGFSLVPWRPELERHLGRRVDGVMTPGRGVAWSFTAKRGLGR